MDTINLRASKSIVYLQGLSLTKTSNFALTRVQADAIRTFLDVKDGVNAESNMYRYVDTAQEQFWMCPAHVHQHLDQESLFELEVFVSSHGGYVDMQHAKLDVELRSTAEADQFQSLLLDSKHIFDISITLNWKATRSNAEKLCLNIARSGTVSLELDGISLEIHPQDHFQFAANLL